MPGPIHRGRAFVERILSNGVETVNTDKIGSENNPVEQLYLSTDDLTVNVPSDFDTISDAIEAICEQQLPNDTSVTLNIEPGHEIVDNIEVIGENLNYINIVSEDSTVPLSDGFGDDDIIKVRSGIGPKLSCLIDANGQGNDGVRVRHGFIYVSEGAGVINAGYRGAYIWGGGTLAAQGADFRGAGHNGLTVTRASRANVSEVDFSDSGGEGIYVSRGSQIHGNDVDCSNAEENGVLVRRSWASVIQGDVSDAGDRGINARNGSWVVAQGVTANDTEQRAIEADHGSVVAATECSIDGCQADITVEAERGSRIDVSESSIENSDFDVFRTGSGCFINAEDATIASPGRDVFGAFGGVLSANGAEVEDPERHVLRCRNGSILQAHGVEVDGELVSEDDADPSSFNSVLEDGIIFSDG